MALRPLDPSIVNAYQAPKFNMPDPLQDVVQLEQIKSARMSRQVDEQKLAQLQRDSTALDEMRKLIVSRGGPENLDVAADAMINTGIPNVMDAGIKIRQKLDFQKNFNLAMSGGTPAPAQPAPVATTAPIQGPVLSIENLSRGSTGIKMRPILPEQAPAPASTNALGLPTNFGENTMAQLRQLERQRDGLSMLAAENPQITPMVAELSRQIAELRRPQTFSPGQTVYVPGQAPFTLPEKSAEQPTLVKEFLFAKSPEGGSFKGTIQDFRVAMAAAGRTPAQPLAPVPALDKTTNQVVYATREQILQNPGRFVPVSEKQETGVVANTFTDPAGNVTQYNKYGEKIGETKVGVGKPSATFEKTAAQKKQLALDLDRIIPELKNAVKPGGLIETSTGSGAGKLADEAAAFFGQSTKGAIAAAQLQPIYDMVLKTVPRFEGPQSNADTKSYERAAGDIGNPAIPAPRKLAAAKEILRLLEARKDQFVTRDMAESGGLAPSGGGVKFLGFE